MASTRNLPQNLSLPAIHAHWTAALSLPPTAQLSTLRRLVRAVTKDHHPALRPLSLTALCPLYLDLALAYAFLGEYYLASQVFKEAVDNDPTSAVSWFGLGLAQAEMAEWKHARRSWKECLRRFRSASGQHEGIRYALFQSQDDATLKWGLTSEAWTLERTRVEFNFRIALREKGSRKLGIAPRAAGEKRPGLNGIVAGLRFGPGWDASLQSLEPSPSPRYSQPAVRTPPSSNTSHSATLPPRISSKKKLPPLPRTQSITTLTLADRGSFNDHEPSLDKDPFTSLTGRDSLDPFSSQTLTTQPDNGYQNRLSRQSTLCTPEEDYFYDCFEDDKEEEYAYNDATIDEEDDEAIDTATAIDDTIASWSSLHLAHEEPIDEDLTLVVEGPEGEENLATDTHEEPPQRNPDIDGELLQPRVFEGFGPPR